MLAPTVSTTQSELSSSVTAAVAVTQYTQAVVTLIPAYYPALTGQWASLQTALQGVVNDASTWPNTLCPAFTQAVPGLFTSFSGTFSQSAQALQNNVQALMQNANNTAARNALVTGLQTLLVALQQLGPPLNTLQTQLIAFVNTLDGDLTTIQNAINALQANIPNGPTVINNAQAALQINFLDTTALGPCNAIVELDSSVSVNLTTILSSAPQAVPVVLVNALLQQIVQSNTDAQTAMSTILDTWSALVGLYTAVINDVNSASSQQLGSILQQLQVTVSLTAWQQLATYAQNLID
jgi:hypothetical protein